MLVKINDSEYEVSINESQISLNGKAFQWDIAKLDSNRFHILHENKSYTAEIISIHPEEKKLVLRINGRECTTTISTDMDLLLQKMGMNHAASKKINRLNAPMPGLVLNILVEQGQEVNTGDSLLILEAMKMENVLKAPGAGKIKSIKVKVRDAVEKNQPLIEFE